MLKKLMFLLLFVVASVNATAATKGDVAKLYVATFNRAADAAGLAYWDGSAAIHTDKTDLKEIAANIILSDEYQALYGGMNRERTIIEMYANLFNRIVDGTDAGIIYWATGGGSSIPLSEMILGLINGAEAPTGNPIDAAVLANKTAVGIAFANAGLNDKEFATAILADITDNTATVTSVLSTYSIGSIPPANSPMDTYFGDSLAFSDVGPNGRVVIIDCVVIATNQSLRLTFSPNVDGKNILMFNAGFFSPDTLLFDIVPLNDNQLASYTFTTPASGTSMPITAEVVTIGEDTTTFETSEIAAPNNAFETATNIMIGSNSCHVYHILK